MNKVAFKPLSVKNNDEINFDIYKEVVQQLRDKLTNIFNNSNIFVKYVEGRVKSEDSLKKKMLNDGLEFNKKNLEKNIFDVAGLRIVCLYKDDIKKIIDDILGSGIKKINSKDYLTTPKESGYSGFHLIVEVPINGQKISAEIQIRTLGMDLFAILDHMLNYKMDINLMKFLKQDLDFFSHYENGLENSCKYNLYEYLRSSKGLFDCLAMSLAVADRRLSELNRNLNKNCNSNNSGKNYFFNLDMSKYNDAMNILNNIMNNEISFVIDDRKIVEHKVGRVKEEKNILSKIDRNYSGCIDNVDIYEEMSKMSDIVGYRLVCPFLCDIGLTFDKLKTYARENPNLIRIPKDKIQDYVGKPKENGYSSYHINALVNINAYDDTKASEWVSAEIQVRTLAMDLWASYQRKLAYHRDVIECQDLLFSFAILCRNIDEAFEPFGKVIRGIPNNSLIEVSDNLPYFTSKMRIKKK